MPYKLFDGRENLYEFLNTKIKNNYGDIVIQAGHFALVYDDNNNMLVPGISKDILSNDIKSKVSLNPYMGEFPVETWSLAVDLVSNNKEKNIKLSIIVNDWQWVPKSKDGNSNNLRLSFYEKNKLLPKSFSEILDKEGLSSDKVFPLINDSKSYLYFGEQKMRNKAKRKYRSDKIKNGSISCAIGYLPFLSYIDEQNISLLISFIPKTCKGPIRYGTDYYFEEINNKTSIEVINIFCNGVSEEEFFSNTEVTF